MSKKKLLNCTALAGVLALIVPTAHAADIDLTSGTSGAISLSSGQNLSVGNAATVTASGSSATVSQSSTTAGASQTIGNAGTISNTGSGRAIDINDSTARRTLSLTNSGTVSSTANDTVRVGKNLAVGSVITITNSGTITSGGSGYAGLGQAIDLRSLTNAVTSTITNTGSGLIESLTDDAVRPGTGTTIENYGLIRSSGANTKGGDNGTSDGIDAGAMTGVTVNNYATGTISGARHGITADTNIAVTNWGAITGRNGSGVGSDGNGTVVNYGTITGAYAGAGNIFDSNGNSSINGDGDGVDIDGIGTITNYGVIQGTGAGGVDSGGQANHAEGVAAGGGTIDNRSGARIYGATSGILVDDGAEGPGVAATTITNAGTIQGGTAYGIRLVGTFNDTLINTGSIIGGGTTAAVDMGAGDDSVTLNGGTISGGAIDGGDGTDSLYFFNGSTGTMILAGDVLDFETAHIYAGQVTLRGAFQASTAVTVDQGASLQADHAFNTAALTVNGTLKAAENGSSRAVTVTGNYSQGSSGVLETRINSTSDYDQVAVTGTATIADGATIRPLSTSYIADGSSFHIVTASGLSVDPSALVLDYSSPLLSWRLSESGNDLVLTATRSQTFASLTTGSSAAGGAVLEQVGATATGDMQDIIASLQTLPSTSAVSNAVRELAPAPSGGIVQGTTAAGNAAITTVQTRMAALRNGQTQVAVAPTDATLALTDAGRAMASSTAQDKNDSMGPLLGVASGPTAAKAGIWAQGFGSTGRQDARDDSQGYRSRTAGFAVGGDTPVTDDTVVGFAGSFARTFVDGRGLQDQDSSRIDSYQLTAYATHSYGASFVEAMVAGGINSYDSRRAIAFLGRNADADFDGWQGLAKVTAGHDFPTGDNGWTVTPVASLQYAHTHVDSYDETGAGAASLAVDSQDYNTLTPGLGVRVQPSPIAVAEGTLTPQASLGVSYDVVSDRQQVTSAFTGGGSAFTTEGADPARAAVTAGLGLTWRDGDVEVGAGYQLEMRDGYTGQAALLRLRHDL